MLWVPRSKRLHLATRFLSVWARIIRHVLHLRLHIEGRLPEETVVIVANHQSYLDIIALAALKPVTFLAKQEVARWPLIGFAARMAGVVFVDRASHTSRADALVEIADRLTNGISVVVFPEGTTTPGPSVKPFRPGIFRFCQERSLAVVPVAIRYEDNRFCFVGTDEFVTHFLRTQRVAQLRVHLRCGDILKPQSPNLRDQAERFITHSLSQSIL